MYESLREMTIGNVICPVYIPKYTSQVMVYLYPFEGDNQLVSKALSAFGTVQDVGNPSCKNHAARPYSLVCIHRWLQGIRINL